jgi:hypothetical protein
VQLQHKAKHGKKGRNLSWHGVVLVGDMLGPGSKCLHSKWPGPCRLGLRTGVHALT